MQFAANARWQEGTLYVQPRGELDVATREEFNRCVYQALAHPFDGLVLDLGGLTFVDSIGLKWILDLWNRSRADEFPMTSFPGQRQVQRAFALSGLDGLMPIEQPAQRLCLSRRRWPPTCTAPAAGPSIEDHAGLLAGVEHCPACQTPLELSPPSLFRGSVRHPDSPAEPQAETFLSG